MRSMTGFGQATGSNPRHAVTVTVRSVNHRFLEIKLRLDDAYRPSEAALKELLETELSRGRVDASVDVQPVGEREVTVAVRRPVVQAAHAAFEELVEGGLVAEKLTAGDLLRLPEAISVRVAPDRWEDDDHTLLLEAAREALEQIVASRRHEGGKLELLLGERAAELAAVVEQLAGLAASTRDEAAEAMRRRLQELLAGADAARFEPGRLEQEVAVLADRIDVSEELDRLGAHLDHFRHLLDSSGAVGKRLDFLTQEILRELNTLGSKCRNAQMTRLVLDGKVLCEQLREQVQNVE
jgi:uncharacterized protein (TIGR00255 family)